MLANYVRDERPRLSYILRAKVTHKHRSCDEQYENVEGAQ